MRDVPRSQATDAATNLKHPHSSPEVSIPPKRQRTEYMDPTTDDDDTFGNPTTTRAVPNIRFYTAAKQENRFEGIGSALSTLLQADTEFFGSHEERPTKPRIVLAFDEASCLSQSRESPDGEKWTPAHVLCRAISTVVRSKSAWVIFASTNSRVVDFSPPGQLRMFNALYHFLMTQMLIPNRFFI